MSKKTGKKTDKESTLNLTVRLFAICAVAALLLGATYTVTKEPIAEQERLAKISAMQEVMPGASNFTDFDESQLAPIVAMYPEVVEVAAGDEGAAGHVITVNTTGYSSGLNVAVGVNAGGEVTGVTITAHAETPGLGSKATDPSFTGQYKDVGMVLEYTVVKSETEAPGEITAIAGATKTTDGVTNAVNTALATYNSFLREAE